jgi:hypothetical protein
MYTARILLDDDLDRRQKIARYRELLVRSDLAISQDHGRHAELLKGLADELAKDIKP